MKTNLYTYIFILTILIFLTNCKKDLQPPTGDNKIEFNNTTVDSVSYSWIQLTTEFNNTGGNEIPQHGYCWSTGQKPTIEDTKIELGSLDNQVNIQITIDSLTNNTNYYIRLFLAYYGGILYGDELNIKTLKTGLPLVLTSEVSEITLVSALCGGTVEADSGLIITARGICWDTINEFNIDDCLNKTINGDSLGVFTSNITELSKGKDYFVKAYATNEKGTGYGEKVSFNTLVLSLPTIETSEVSNITCNTAQCGGNVISNGNGIVSLRGICWNKTGNPTIENCIDYTVDGNGTGVFISFITNLNIETEYFVNAYAINEKGIVYGETKIINTLAEPPCGELIVDYGGQTYNTILIGEQCWMKENLNIGTRIDGENEQTDNGAIEKFCYNDNDANCNEYGGLYEWNEMMQYSTMQNSQGICPDGWHIPTDNEWKILEGTVDSQYPVGDPEWDQNSGRGFDVGFHLKSQNGWISNGNGSNEFGFTALPGGYLVYPEDYFSNIFCDGFFWTSTTANTFAAWFRYLDYSVDYIYRIEGFHDQGMSVRCLKN